MSTVEERFWAKVDRSGDCWLWTAYAYANKYGRFWDGTRVVKAHRFAYELMVGSVPPGMDLDHRHTCSKRCVNPGHLRPATRKQNCENRAGAQANSQSGVRGVRWDKARGRWAAAVQHNGKMLQLGRFDTIEAAEAAVIAKRCELFTHNDRDRVVA